VSLLRVRRWVVRSRAVGPACSDDTVDGTTHVSFCMHITLLTRY